MLGNEFRDIAGGTQVAGPARGLRGLCLRTSAERSNPPGGRFDTSPRRNGDAHTPFRPSFPFDGHLVKTVQAGTPHGEQNCPSDQPGRVEKR